MTPSSSIHSQRTSRSGALFHTSTFNLIITFLLILSTAVSLSSAVPLPQGTTNNNNRNSSSRNGLSTNNNTTSNSNNGTDFILGFTTPEGYTVSARIYLPPTNATNCTATNGTTATNTNSTRPILASTNTTLPPLNSSSSPPTNTSLTDIGIQFEIRGPETAGWAGLGLGLRMLRGDLMVAWRDVTGRTVASRKTGVVGSFGFTGQNVETQDLVVPVENVTCGAIRGANGTSTNATSTERKQERNSKKSDASGNSTTDIRGFRVTFVRPLASLLASTGTNELPTRFLWAMGSQQINTSDSTAVPTFHDIGHGFMESDFLVLLLRRDMPGLDLAEVAAAAASAANGGGASGNATGESRGTVNAVDVSRTTGGVGTTPTVVVQADGQSGGVTSGSFRTVETVGMGVATWVVAGLGLMWSLL
ncbi:hypothetical protein HK102_003568 [Quaeritorhiza haematococci]|nr:hypothetical protein HK102_003568 [Quaeritorhiza haematococci]